MHLNLSDSNPSKLLQTLQTAFMNKDKNVTLDLLGPGLILNDTALMLYEEIRNRPSCTKVHIHSRTCLFDGAILLWLAGDTRTIRSDAWIQVSEIPDAPIRPKRPKSRRLAEYSNAIPIIDEYPAETDLRTVIKYLGEWLPVDEIAGLRLFESELRDLGLLHDAESDKTLTSLFKGLEHPVVK